jgi:hypothetical protein
MRAARYRAETLRQRGLSCCLGLGKFASSKTRSNSL